MRVSEVFVPGVFRIGDEVRITGPFKGPYLGYTGVIVGVRRHEGRAFLYRVRLEGLSEPRSTVMVGPVNLERWSP